MANPLLNHFSGDRLYECIHPDKNKKEIPYYGSFDLLQNNLQKANDNGYGVYFALNEFTEAGVRKKSKFKRALAVWLEDDGDKHGDTDFGKFPLPPSCIVESSPGKHHIYWFTETDNVDEWLGVMQSLCAEYNGDPGGIKVTQLLRVPGFPNTKYEHRPMVAILGGNQKTYSWSDIKNAFPPKEVVVHKDPDTGKDSVNRKNVLDIKVAIREMLTGESLYPNMIRLASSYAVKRYYRKDIYANIKAILELAKEFGVEPERIFIEVNNALIRWLCWHP